MSCSAMRYMVPAGGIARPAHDHKSWMKTKQVRSWLAKRKWPQSTNGQVCFAAKWPGGLPGGVSSDGTALVRANPE